MSKEENQEKNPHEKLIELFRDTNNLKGCMDASEAWCQNIRISGKGWQPSEPPKSRVEQILGSIHDRLKKFGHDHKRLDKARWSKFRVEIIPHPSLESDIQKVIKTANFSEVFWTGAASVELDSLFNYLDNLIEMQSDTDYLTLVNAVTSDRLQVIASEFLTLYVRPLNKYKSTDRLTNLDGASSSCPISLTPAIGVQYFAQAAGEYLLMTAIVKKFNIKTRKFVTSIRSQDNDESS